MFVCPKHGKQPLTVTNPTALPREFVSLHRLTIVCPACQFRREPQPS